MLTLAECLLASSTVSPSEAHSTKDPDANAAGHGDIQVDLRSISPLGIKVADVNVGLSGHECFPVGPNVRAKRATTAGRQARAVENLARRRPGLVACRWRSA